MNFKVSILWYFNSKLLLLCDIAKSRIRWGSRHKVGKGSTLFNIRKARTDIYCDLIISHNREGGMQFFSRCTISQYIRNYEAWYKNMTSSQF